MLLSRPPDSGSWASWLLTDLLLRACGGLLPLRRPPQPTVLFATTWVLVGTGCGGPAVTAQASVLKPSKAASGSELSMLMITLLELDIEKLESCGGRLSSEGTCSLPLLFGLLAPVGGGGAMRRPPCPSWLG